MDLQQGQVLDGDLFSEPMRILTVEVESPGRWTVGLVGVHSSQFRSVSLTEVDMNKLRVLPAAASFRGDSLRLRLGLQAYALGVAYEFDPYLALSVSRVDPLPHQLEAVYDHLLKLARVHFLLADDAGAGKTIMAGLLLRELKLRGLIERILIICPANLTFQWQREMKDKFTEHFDILRGSELRSQYGVNPWRERKQVITSMDLARKTDVLPSLRQAGWDLVIVDEAHRMSAAAEDKKTQRYQLGELLRDTTSHLLMLTATPHKGDPENFSLFLQLLDRDAYADVRSIREAMNQRRAPFYLRRTKEAMVYFPERQPDGTWASRKIFTKRIPHTAHFELGDSEYELYRQVTKFLKVRAAMAAAREEADTRARAVGFLVTLFQRRLASSMRAMKVTLERRASRLEGKLQKADDFLEESPLELPSNEDLEEMEEGDREAVEERIEAIVLTRNRGEILEEVQQLREFAGKAQEVIDRKSVV